MSRLRHAELRRFSDAVWELNTPVSVATLSDHLLRSVARLVDVDRVSYNEVNRASGRLVHAHSLGDPPSPELVASLNAHIHQHPGFTRPDSGADFPALTKISDSLSQRQFRQLGLYQEHFKLYGIHYQLGASFALTPECKISFGLNRQKRDFAESERLMMGLLRPHLRRVCQQTRLAAEVNAAAEVHAASGVNATDGQRENFARAIVLLDDLGQVEFATARALQLLHIYGPGQRGYAEDVRSPLPPPVAQWFHQQTGGSPASLKIGLGTSSWSVRQGNSELRLQLLEETSLDKDTWKTSRRWLLKLTERPAFPTSEPLRQLGLSPREAELLLWLARGKRNAEIASICGLSTSTVSTHLRNIFPKLGVETRTAAAAIAWQTLSAGSVSASVG